MAVSLLNWLKWGWTFFSSEGLWKKIPSKKKKTVLISESKQE